jgi:hypothetical protein
MAAYLGIFYALNKVYSRWITSRRKIVKTECGINVGLPLKDDYFIFDEGR